MRRLRDTGYNTRLSIFTLKIIALIAMLADHLEGTFPNTFPVVFGWMGRIAIPIFMFCVIQGLVHTSNVRKYLIRLYIGSVVMSVGSFILEICFTNAGLHIADNIFSTFFLLALFITLAKAKMTRNRKVGLWIGLLLIQVISFLIVTWLQPVSTSYVYLANGFIPNIITCQGSVIFILLGIFMYIFRNHHRKFTAFYIIFCAVMLTIAGIGGFTVHHLFYQNYQWIMIIALPLMSAYSGKRGKSLKQFFYTFYPLHIWILFVVANLLTIR